MGDKTIVIVRAEDHPTAQLVIVAPEGVAFVEAERVVRDIVMAWRESDGDDLIDYIDSHKPDGYGWAEWGYCEEGF